jgi:hypothetical protein
MSRVCPQTRRDETRPRRKKGVTIDPQVSRRALVVLVAVAVVAGCGGGEQQTFTMADARALAKIRPVAPGWTWPANPHRRSSASGSGQAGSDPLVSELERRMAKVDSLGEATNKWRDSDKLGNLDVGVFGSTADAHDAMEAMNAFSRGEGERNGQVTKDEEFDGLGDEAWRLWVGGSGTQVTYHWRRGNLVVEAHVHCFGECPADADSAARAWADAVDAAAQARP